MLDGIRLHLSLSPLSPSLSLSLSLSLSVDLPLPFSLPVYLFFWTKAVQEMTMCFNDILKMRLYSRRLSVHYLTCLRCIQSKDLEFSTCLFSSFFVYFI